MATQRICTIPGCGKKFYSRSLCKAHYNSDYHSRNYVSKRKPRISPGLVFIKEALSSDTDDCILWPYAKVSGGYGTTRVSGKSVTTHRYVCEQTHGQSNLYACHRCDVPACVNPRHIRWGTPKENSSDMRLRGRSLTGEKSQASRLTESNVREIRSALSKPLKRGDIMKLARRYDVDKATICDIRAGRTWNHIT